MKFLVVLGALSSKSSMENEPQIGLKLRDSVGHACLFDWVIR